jgi:NADH:ubiquinone oxidoreductase subunit F (NADH-binding)/(2Fe-2S) ferredoxin/NAD-dependent dihydropyrimidine dehydrogenase PreA subunit
MGQNMDANMTKTTEAAGKTYRAHVLVCGGTGCVSADSLNVIAEMRKEIARRNLEDEVRVVQTGCRGFCAMGPIMMIYPEGTFYCQVTTKDVPEIVEETLVKGRQVKKLLYQEPKTHQVLPLYQDMPFYSKQMRVVLKNCGLIDPERIEEYIAEDGYKALEKVLTEMSGEDVINEIKKSGLRGRGGAGFSTGQKWEFVRKAKGDKKYIVCNADEGDPGAFMDRSLLEGDPHRLIEGMTICAYCTGADEGYIYCRAEYPLAIRRLKIAIAQAEEYGLLGENILGTDFSFKLNIKEGAGAFVCGEETALLASIEGKRGMPRPRPPFPAISGLWKKPTNINNVKTYCNVREIIRNGADWFASIGTETSKGTAIFALTGKINNTGLVEVPMGITLREIIYDIGGGVPNGKKFKAAQTGGPSGGCLPEKFLDTPIDYETLTKLGAMMGSGGLIVMDEDSCMVNVARFFLEFVVDESCGKCPPCRVGTRQMHAILERICNGQGKMEDLDKLEELANMCREASLCGLGQTAPNPVLSTLRHFREEYIAHIQEKRCPAKVCSALLEFRINEEKCVGCSLCSRACPTGTIFKRTDAKKYYIVEDKCIRCGACFDACKFDSVYKLTGPDAKLAEVVENV